jgi:acylphosphatase
LNCRVYLVSGRVQGVFFRQSTLKQARRLKLSGYAKNLEDGRVEIIVCGRPSAIRALEEWLQEGPPFAHVEEVETQEMTTTASFSGFSIRS